MNIRSSFEDFIYGWDNGGSGSQRFIESLYKQGFQSVTLQEESTHYVQDTGKMYHHFKFIVDGKPMTGTLHNCDGIEIWESSND